MFQYILGGEQLLNSLKKGDFFGERALEDSQGKRTANIIANPGDDGGEYLPFFYVVILFQILVFYLKAFNLFIFTISGLTTCLVIDRYSYKQLISNKFTIPDYKQPTKKVTVDNEFNALRLRDLRIVATLGVGGMLYMCSNVI